MLVRDILLAPDSFKGTLSALTVCEIEKRALSEAFPNAKIRTLPLADGGEGTLTVMQAALGGRLIFHTVPDLRGEPVSAPYLLLPDEMTAVLELATCAALPKKEYRAAEKHSTYGLGILAGEAVKAGAKRLIFTLGGSGTHDCGCGLASALGVKFRNSGGESFVPVGQTLCDVASVDLRPAEAFLAGVQFTCMCDVKNPLLGEHGAARTFAPQKGADEKTVALLERNSAQLASLFPPAFSSLPGGGAAGGVGFGLAAFFGAEVKSGIETLLDLSDFDALLKNCDLVITGEGKADSQSLGGKVLSGIMARTAKAGVPLWVLAGTAEDGFCPSGIAGLTVCVPPDTPLSEITAHAEENLYKATKRAAREIAEL